MLKSTSIKAEALSPFFIFIGINLRLLLSNKAQVKAHSDIKKTSPNSGRLDLTGALGRNRTCDQWFRKPLLYPLSYERLVTKNPAVAGLMALESHAFALCEYSG